MTIQQSLKLTSEGVLQQVKLLIQLPQVAKAISTRRIIQSTAQSLAVNVSSQALQAAADTFRQKNQLYTTEETFAWLKQHYLSLDDLEEILRSSLLSSQVAEKLFTDKVEAYFYQHRFDYERAAYFEIIFDDVDIAMEAYYAICEKEVSFPEVAHEYLTKPSIRRTWGYQGLVERKDIKPEVSAAIFSATPPVLLKPVVSAQGSHLIYVEDIISAELDDALEAKILNELFANWLKEESQKVTIEGVDD